MGNTIAGEHIPPPDSEIETRIDLSQLSIKSNAPKPDSINIQVPEPVHQSSPNEDVDNNNVMSDKELLRAYDQASKPRKSSSKSLNTPISISM